jgi:hypothetical protein
MSCNVLGVGEKKNLEIEVIEKICYHDCFLFGQRCNRGATVCKTCIPGTNSANSASMCTIRAPGAETFAPTHTTACKSCPPVTFSDAEAEECALCPNGTFAAPGAAACETLII